METIQKYISGKKYANTNVKSKDGKIAYMTSTGVSKLYPSQQVYESTAGKNNCKSGFIQLTPSWNDVGFPVGSLMKSGQSCGNENKYVQAEPPQTTFDWQFYLRNNGDLGAAGIKTEQQAMQHWNAYGKREGRLPNESIVSSLSTLGKVGYIDVDTNLHEVPATFTQEYKSFESRNLTGLKMQDCTTPIPTIKYGEPLVFSQQNASGFLNSSSLLEFGSQKTNFFLRPPPGEDRQGVTVKYGDYVCISSSSSSYTNDCGWWGCKVANVNKKTNKLEFGPGGKTTATFRIIPPVGTVYDIGSELKYGFPFSIMSMPVGNVEKLRNGQSTGCKEGKELPNGVYKGVYRYTGNNTLQHYPNPPIASSWDSDWRNMKTIDCTTYVAGEPLQTLNTSNFTIGQSVACRPKNSGVGLYRYSDKNIMRQYTTAEIANLWDKNWTQYKWGDCSTYTAGDIMTEKIDEDNPENDVPKLAYVSTTVSFGTFSEANGKHIFSFQPNTPLKNGCDIEELKQKCGNDCVGFVHSPSTNSWQTVNAASTTADYKISPTEQTFYMKKAAVTMNDTSCQEGDVSFIDSNLFSNYPKGKKFEKDGKGQCKIIDPPTLTFEKDNEIDEVKQKAQNFNPTALLHMQQQNKKLTSDMTTKTNEYSSVLNTIKKTNTTDTLIQQKDDLLIFDERNKMHAILWGVLATTILAFVVFRPR
jgi:hypothetical protein